MDFTPYARNVRLQRVLRFQMSTTETTHQECVICITLLWNVQLAQASICHFKFSKLVLAHISGEAGNLHIVLLKFQDMIVNFH